MRSLRLAYIIAFTFLLSITLALGLVAFYPAPQPPKSSLLSFSTGSSQSSNYQDDLKNYEQKSKNHGRNQFMISLFFGVALVVVGVSFSTVYSAISTAMVLAGGLTFSFGQVLLFTANIGSLLARYAGSGSGNYSSDLIMEFFVSLIGSLILLVVGFSKFRDDQIVNISVPVPEQSINRNSLPPR